MPQPHLTTSTFEILGPIMVGPSSSHTAGALRCAQVAASLMEAPVVRVRFVLHNSFAHTYRGHGTDRALVAQMTSASAMPSSSRASAGSPSCSFPAPMTSTCIPTP